MTIKDITDRFDDLNPDLDRVYRSDSGYTVKVKSQRVHGAAGIITVRVSAALCDDKTAKAVPHGVGHFILPAREATIMAAGVDADEMKRLIEKERQQAVREVEWAAINQAALDAIPGLRAPL